MMFCGGQKMHQRMRKGRRKKGSEQKGSLEYGNMLPERQERSRKVHWGQ